jgi:hypothetical protein
MEHRIATRRQALAQVVLCQGCCCGRTDRGRPEVPVARMKAVWKEEKLNAAVQLTVSGCLGPCDAANVVLLLTPGNTEWLGCLPGPGVYEAFITWARASRAAGAAVPLPAELEQYRLRRFAEGKEVRVG